MTPLKRSDFQEGQIVYLLHVQPNYTIDDLKSNIIETSVVRIGRKYLTVNYWGKMEFDMTNDFREKTPYSPNFILYRTKEEIYDDIGLRIMRRTVRNNIDKYINSFTMEELTTIQNIINEHQQKG